MSFEMPRISLLLAYFIVSVLNAVDDVFEGFFELLNKKTFGFWNPIHATLEDLAEGAVNGCSEKELQGVGTFVKAITNQLKALKVRMPDFTAEMFFTAEGKEALTVSGNLFNVEEMVAELNNSGVNPDVFAPIIKEAMEAATSAGYKVPQELVDSILKQLKIDSAVMIGNPFSAGAKYWSGLLPLPSVAEAVTH